MRDFLWRHRALFGYVFLVTVAVFAVELHHHQTNNEINANAARIEANADAVCHAAKEVTANQEFILKTQLMIIRHEHRLTNGFALGLVRRETEIERRLATLPEYRCRDLP